MNECVPPPRADLATAGDLRAVVIDELSDVRYIHAGALRAQAAEQLSQDEIDAFVGYVYSEAYTERLAEMVRARRLLGITVDGKLTSTAGWTPANDSGATARLMAVFVGPLFTGVGLGRRVALAAEADAAQAGFRAASVRTPIGAVGFFQRLGYDVSSYGVWTLKPDCALPVGFMRKPLDGGHGAIAGGEAHKDPL